MANYSDKDLHWITVHPNGKEEKPGVKIAINGAGKVVKGPKGLKDDINAEGGLPGAKSLPLDELKKQKGNGGAGAAGGGGEGKAAGTGENAFSVLTDALGGLLDDGNGGGEVGVTSPKDAASSLLDDEAGTASGGEKPSGAKLCESAKKWLSECPIVDQYLKDAGSQEALEKALSSLSEDDFETDNGYTVILTQKLGKLFDAIEAAKKGKGSAAGGVGESKTPFTDKQIDNFASKYYGAFGLSGSEEDKQLLKGVITEHPELFAVSKINPDILTYTSPNAAGEAVGLVLDKQAAIAQAKKEAEQASGEPPLCPKAKKWLASGTAMEEVWTAKFGSEEAFKEALSKLDDEDFLASLFDITLTPDGVKKLDAMAKGGKQAEAGENAAPPLCEHAKQLLAEKGADYKMYTKEILKKFGVSESEAEAKLTGYLAEIGDDHTYALHASAVGGWKLVLSEKGEKAIEALIDKDAASAGGSSSGGAELCDKAKEWMEEDSGEKKLLLKNIKDEFAAHGVNLTDEEAEAKLKEYAASLTDEDFGGGPGTIKHLYLAFAGHHKMVNAIKQDVGKAGGGGNGAEPVLNPLAEAWLGTSGTAFYVNELTKAGLTEEEAKEKLKEIAATLNADDFDSKGYLSATGENKVIMAANKLAQENADKAKYADPALLPAAEKWINHPASTLYRNQLKEAGLSEEEAKEKLKEIYCSLTADEIYPKMQTPNADGFSKIIEAVKRAAAEAKAKGAGAWGAGDPSLTPADQSAAASGQTLSENWVKSEQAKEHYIPEITDQLGLEGDAAEAKLAELAAQLGGEDFNGDGSITWSGGKKIMDAIEKEKAEKAASAEKMKELVKKNKLCKKAAEWLMGDAASDGGSVLGKEYFVAVAKDQFGVGDAEAEEMVAQALSKLNGKNFTPQGGLTTLGYKKMKIALAAMHPQGGAEGGAQAAAQTNLSPFDKQFLAAKGETYKKYVKVIQDKFGVSESEAEAKLAGYLAEIGVVGYAPQWHNNGGWKQELNDIGQKEIEAAIEKDKAAGGAESAAPVAPAAQAAKPLPPPKPAKPVSPELTAGNVPFPKDEKALSGLTMVKPLGGASGAHATLYKDASGNMFVMKKYAATDKAGQARLKEECDADAFYLSGGANVPHFRLYGDEKSGYTKLSQYIPGTKTLGETWKTADAATKEKIRQNLRKDFALDVMAGAWDVLGTGRDNILVDGEGNVWRCDNGGAFNRRAQGGEKDEAAWGSGHIDDLWTMRGMSASLDGKKIPDGTGKAEFFGDITTHQLLSDIVTRDWDKMTAHLPEATRQVMAKRIANAKEYHAVCDNVVVDGMYGDGQHSEDITLNYHCLNKFGARAGCVNKNVGPHNWGWCRGDGNGHPAPKLEDFTKAPEPTLEQFLPSANKKDAEQKLLAAGKTINHHLFDEKDGSVNKASVEAALALKPSLETVANEGGKDAAKAKEMLAFLDEVQKVKDGGYKMLDHKFGFAPSGEVDLNSAAAKAEAQAKFAEAHKAWQETTKNAQAKYAAAKKKWEKENGGGAFKWKNLTDCFEDFCKQNGIESSRFWTMAHGQAGSSQGKGSSRMKVLELLSMGGDLDHPYTSVKGISDHTVEFKNAADEYKTHPDWLARDMKAYTAMKSLTQMILHNSSFVGNFPDRKCVRLCRTENYDAVIDKYDIEKGVPTVYNTGTHESFGIFDTYCYKGHEAVICDVPYSRISSLYFLLDPEGHDMYNGENENEAGVNATGLARVYCKYVSGGEKITTLWGLYEEAMKKPIVYAKNKNKATSL